MKGRLTVAAAAAMLVAVANPAAAATATYTGPGWRIETGFGVKSVSPTQQFWITFPSQKLKDRYVPYLSYEVSQLNAAGIHVKFGGIETPVSSGCAPQRHIQYTEAYRPLAGRAGYSQGLPCYNTADHSLWSGVVKIDTEYWNGQWYLSTVVRKNILTHEMGHAFGLDHANWDYNHNGVVEDYECLKSKYGTTPLMCSPNGGYQTTTTAGRLTGWDLSGISALVSNAQVMGVR